MNNWYHKNTLKNFLFNLEKPVFCGHFWRPWACQTTHMQNQGNPGFFH